MSAIRTCPHNDTTTTHTDAGFAVMFCMQCGEAIREGKVKNFPTIEPFSTGKHMLPRHVSPADVEWNPVLAKDCNHLKTELVIEGRNVMEFCNECKTLIRKGIAGDVICDIKEHSEKTTIKLDWNF